MDYQEIWKITLAQIEVKLDSPAQYKTWFKDSVLLDIRGKDAQIGVRNTYAAEWLKKKHNKLIKETLSYVYGSEVEPNFFIDKRLANTPTPKVTADEIIKESPMLGFIQQGGDPALVQAMRRANLNENYTFGNFIVGPSNKLAHAASQGTVLRPGEAYNPLFIYGKTGLGKTHLGQAVARAVLEKDPAKKVSYLSSEGFLNDMVKALKTARNIEFRQKYRTLDVLIIDDIQFAYKWKETQTEFFHTFNELYNDKKQIILISDRPPEQIKNLESRLVSRFQGGIIVDIGRPDFEMRLAILEKKAKQMNIELPNNIFEYLAKTITDNIRELEGALQKVALYNSMREENLSIEEIAKILGKDNKSKRDKIKVPGILKTIAREFSLTVKELKGPRRTADLAFARQVSMYILREEFGYKLEQVAKFLERQDHTTVLHAVDKIKSKILVDEGFKNQLDLLKEAITKNEQE